MARLDPGKINKQNKTEKIQNSTEHKTNKLLELVCFNYSSVLILLGKNSYLFAADPECCFCEANLTNSGCLDQTRFAHSGLELNEREAAATHWASHPWNQLPEQVNSDEASFSKG